MQKITVYLLLTLLISCKSNQFVTSDPFKQLNDKTQFTNIKIDEASAFLIGPCEPSIAINPKNPKNMVAGSVLDNAYYSFDSGHTWTKLKMVSNEFGVYGDPCIVSDFEGNFYYLHLANPDGKPHESTNFLNQMVIQKSSDGGITWNAGVGMGYNLPKQQDKEWAVVHLKTGQIYVTWTEFDKYGSDQKHHKSRIRFATSSDKGLTFSPAQTISDIEGDALDDDRTTEGAVPAVSNDGNIFVAWSIDNKIYFDSSFDNGKTWNKDVLIAQQPEGWTQDIPGIGRCNGMPITVVDNSKSAYQGNIYVNWTDQRNGKDNTDVFLIKSSDMGKTWSNPIQVNQDKTQTHQFFTWMTLDPITGYLYFIYYDRSQHTDNKTDVVLSVTKDGGDTFVSKIISESSFDPNPDCFFGDYNNISAYNGIVRPIWTRYEDGKLSVWTALINFHH